MLRSLLASKDHPRSRVPNSMVGTQAPQEGSVTASLRELERLEAERIRELHAQERREREAQETARREAARREEEERLARERRDEEAWLARARLERDEAVRAAAIERAIIERAKTEAAERAIVEERERAHGREIELAAASHVREHARLRRTAIALSLGMAAVVLGGALVDTTVLAPRWERRVAAASADVMSRDETISDLRARLVSQEGATTSARNDLAQAASRQAVLEAQLGEARREIDKLRRTRSAPPPLFVHPPETGFSTKCAPDSRDPLCANLGR
jgi:colicin import membrane protein